MVVVVVVVVDAVVEVRGGGGVSALAGVSNGDTGEGLHFVAGLTCLKAD